MGQTRTLFVYFKLFSHHGDKYSTKFEYIKAMMVCLGFKHKMVGTAKTTKRVLPPKYFIVMVKFIIVF